MSAVRTEICPETGIGSILRGDTAKVDLMPDEVAAIRTAARDPAKVRAVIASADAAFAEALSDGEIKQIVAKVLKSCGGNCCCSN